MRVAVLTLQTPTHTNALRLKLCVPSSGLDYTKPVFGPCTAPGAPAASCKVLYAQDMTTNDNLLDSTGHGTNVAGIILSEWVVLVLVLVLALVLVIVVLLLVIVVLVLVGWCWQRRWPPRSRGCTARAVGACRCTTRTPACCAVLPCSCGAQRARDLAGRV
jgi:hypothetical protein